MKGFPGKFKSGHYFHDADMEQIIQGSYKILSQIGMKITDEKISEKMQSSGFSLKNGRVLIEERIAKVFLEEARQRMTVDALNHYIGNAPHEYEGWINPYAHHYEDPESWGIVPFDTEALTKMSEFINSFCKGKGITPCVPGYPNDVPGILESLARYKISAECCDGNWRLEPASRLSAKYMFEMADVIEKPMNTLNVFAATPLCLGDESLYIALEQKDRVDTIHVRSMPSFGANTPMSVASAFSLALAEILGSAIIVRTLTDKDVVMHVNIFPFDFRSLNMVFGSPEKLLFEWLSIEFNSKLFGLPFRITQTDIHTWAKKAGIQAAIEKSTLIMAGALKGATYFKGIGALSADEIFSPLQLIMDIEIMTQAAKIVAGFEKEPIDEDIVGIINRGIDGGFVCSDQTLDNHERFIWYSELFEHSSLQSWINMGEKEVLNAAREIYYKTISDQNRYELEEHQKKELDALFHRAMKEIK